MSTRPITTAPDPDGGWDLIENLLDDPAIQTGDTATLKPLVDEFENELVNTRGKVHYADDLDDFGDYSPTPWNYGKNQTAKTTWGGAKAGTKTSTPAWRRGGWSSRSAGTYTSRYADYDYSAYSRTSYSSWYSGYSSTKAAMRGVHRSASGFARDPKRAVLSIYPSSSESLEDRKLHLEDGLHVRIDATLYEELGIEKAQQHYTVDAIGQVLALQAMANPELAIRLQNLDGQLPRAIREVVTEVIRRRGLELLASEAPGWITRIDALREAIALQDRPDGTTLSPHVARFDALMKAAWLPSDLSDPLVPPALDLILRLDDLLTGATDISLARQFASDLRAFLASDSDAMQAAVAIEKLLPTIEAETLKIQALCPEPPIAADTSAVIKTGLEDIDQRVTRLRKSSLAHKSNAALAAGLCFLRDGPHAKQLAEMDALTVEVDKARSHQMQIDRACDAIRQSYEKQLRSKHNGTTLSTFLAHESLSILWAHASMDNAVLSVTASDIRAKAIGAATPALLPQLILELNAMRADYNTKTRELFIAAQQADQIEAKLSELINSCGEDSKGGVPVWARFASCAGVECSNELAALLDDIRSNSQPPQEDFRPQRKCDNEGEGDSLAIDGSGESDDAEPGDSKSDRHKLAQNHDDLIAEGAVQADLPQIGTDDDVARAPDIVIYDATDPDRIAR
jgi:hypothetical protein